MNIFSYLLSTILYGSLIIGAQNTSFDKNQECWPWEHIDTTQLHFDKNFLFGTAMCEFQNSGNWCTNSTWTDWQKYVPPVHNSCEFNKRYKDDIKRMQELGIKTLRFSVEWCLLEPREGEFDEQIFKHYHDLIDTLLTANIIPMITLHHFNDPLWFAQKGGFEQEDNTAYFARYAARVFKEFGQKVHLWCTINEPTVYVFQGWIRGVFPPGKKARMLQAFEVLKNLMKAHVEAYQAIKALDTENNSLVSVAHQYLKFYPYHVWNPIEKIVGFVLNPLLHDVVFNFYKTGKFSYKLGYGLVNIEYKAPTDKFLDYVGLNYYSRVLIELQASLTEPIKSSKRPHEIMTDMPYPIYGEGLYHAIKIMSGLNLPIYITENGIADTTDTRRELFISRYLYALSEAIKDGYDVRGYYYWSLLDNYEWDMGYTQRFGLYEVNFETQERTLRNGSKRYIDIIKQCA